MFANCIPLVQLISNDTSASDEEKKRAISAIQGLSEVYEDPLRNKVVIGFEDAVVMLGYKSKSGVYAAIARGELKGYYSGSSRRRAKGVLASSIYEYMNKGKAR